MAFIKGNSSVAKLLNSKKVKAKYEDKLKDQYGKKADLYDLLGSADDSSNQLITEREKLVNAMIQNKLERPSIGSAGANQFYKDYGGTKGIDAKLADIESQLTRNEGSLVDRYKNTNDISKLNEYYQTKDSSNPNSAKMQAAYDEYNKQYGTQDPATSFRGANNTTLTPEQIKEYQYRASLVNQPAPGTPTDTNLPPPNTAGGSTAGAPTESIPTPPGVTLPEYGGISPANSPSAVDEQKLLAEAEAQKKFNLGTLDTQKEMRSTQLNDLAKLLSEQTNSQMSDMSPGIYEDLNSRGLLMSSALGDRMATEKGKITRDMLNQLGQQGVQGMTQDIGTVGSIQDAYNNYRNAAVQRGFTLADYEKQFRDSKELGFNASPLAQATPSNKGASTMAGASLGAALAAPTGGMSVVAGSALGGAAGLVGGGK